MRRVCDYFELKFESSVTQNVRKKNCVRRTKECTPNYVLCKNCKGQSINEWIWDVCLTSPTDFAGADDIITDLAKEREPGI